VIACSLVVPYSPLSLGKLPYAMAEIVVCISKHLSAESDYPATQDVWFLLLDMY
jgi:hypothetical protein